MSGKLLIYKDDFRFKIGEVAYVVGVDACEHQEPVLVTNHHVASVYSCFDYGKSNTEKRYKILSSAGCLVVSENHLRKILKDEI